MSNRRSLMSELDQKTPLSVHSRFKSMADDVAELRMLDLIEQSPRISQRKITAQTGLAAGLVHSMMKRVIAKGWVKATQVSARRWLYYLSPEGFYEKSRLTLEYLSSTVNNYRKTQELVEENLAGLVEAGMTRLAVAGDNDLADIVALNVKATDGLTLVAPLGEREGRRPFTALKTIDCDAVLVCDVAFLNWWRADGPRLGITTPMRMIGLPPETSPTAPEGEE